MTTIDVSEWLNERLKERGWKDADLCRAGDIDSATLSTARKRNAIGPDLAMRIASGLGISQARVFFELGIMTEKPGAPVLADPILADIWNLVEAMDEDNRRAARVLLERMFPRGESDGRREPANSGASGKTKRG